MTAIAETPVPPPPPETKRRKKAPDSHEANPSKAGWFTRIVLAVLVFLWTVPTLGILVSSFRTTEDTANGGWWTLLTDPGQIGRLTFDNYQTALDRLNLSESFINSFAIALPATFIPILIAAFAAYAFTFMEFKGRDVLFVVIVSLLIVPNFVAFVPMLQIYSEIGIGGTFPSVWLFHIGFGMSLAIYILRNYMATLPRTIIESAKIDGASHFQTFFRLVLPMSTPALAAFAIFQFLWVWNDLLVALVFLGPGERAPLTVSVSQLLGQQGQNQELVTASGMLSMIVPILVFLALQRYFVRGMTAGAVKG